MIDFGGNKIGHPWHGLWRQSTGKITTPTGVVIDVHGDAMQGIPAPFISQFAGVNTPYCYCFKLEVPGLPPVSTTTAEAEAGETWTKYATLTGFSNRLYGKSLGSKSWIYIAPNGRRWRVWLTYTQSSYEEKILEISLFLRTFGEVSGDLLSFSGLRSSIELNVGTTLTGGWFDIDDIKSDGSGVLIAGYVFQINGDVKKRVCHSIVEVSISGNYPAFEMTLNQIASEVTDMHSTIINTANYKYLDYKWNQVTLTYDLEGTFTNSDDGLIAPGLHEYLVWPISTMTSIDTAEVIGARYSSAGVAQVITVRRVLHQTYSATLEPAGVFPIDASGFGKTVRGTVTATRSATGHVSVLSASTEISRIDLSGSSSGGGSINPSGETEFPPGPGLAYSGSWSIGSESSAVYPGSGYFPFINNIFGIHGWRYSNTVYGLIGIWSSDLTTDWGWFFPAIGRNGQDNTTIKLASAGGEPYYGSEHPENGAVTRSDSPVCYV